MQKSVSILLPTYNCHCERLVTELQRQCVEEQADFEIIVADDGSTIASYTEHNLRIERLKGVCYIIRERNIGRSSIRNFLVSQATKDWLLFIDGDLSLDNPHFIRNYLDADGDVIVGGLKIGGDEKKWGNNLRYRYERATEKLQDAESRAKHPYQHTSTNFMVRKKLMGENPYNTDIKGYGYEDVLLGKDFQKKQLKVNHINNPVLFDFFEPNDVFITKTEESLRTLYNFKNELKGYSRLLAIIDKLKKMHVCGIVSSLYGILHRIIKQQLLSNNPSIFLFNFYKLMYFVHYESSKS